ncbi:hypothetical protein LguiA_003780 [Lonicera macranthoides]
MEVMVQTQNTDFDFNTARSTPYSTSPSTPTRIGEYYFSAPTSPTRISSFYSDFADFLVVSDVEIVNDCGASVPFDWEEKPGKPKHSSQLHTKCEVDFAFDVNQEMAKISLSADELFDGGKIRPHFENQKRPLMDPILDSEKRGRVKVSSHRRTQSVTPMKTSDYEFKEEELIQFEQNKSSKPPLASSNSALSLSSSKGYIKWRLKDFFLFRSASEGRAIDKDPLQKYTQFFKKQEFYKRSSFKAIETPSSSRSGSMRRGRVSAHELHYTVNRAVSEDLKRKTFLPYKQGILGRFAFNPAVHAIANGFGLSRGSETD